MSRAVSLPARAVPTSSCSCHTLLSLGHTQSPSAQLTCSLESSLVACRDSLNLSGSACSAFCTPKGSCTSFFHLQPHCPAPVPYLPLKGVPDPSCPVAPFLQPSNPNIPHLLLPSCPEFCRMSPRVPVVSAGGPEVTLAGEGGTGFPQLAHTATKPIGIQSQTLLCLHSGMEFLQQIQLWKHCLVHPKGSSSLHSPLASARASPLHPPQLQTLIFLLLYLPAQGYFPCTGMLV